MGRADDLRAELAEIEPEETAIARLSELRAVARDNPGDLAAKDAAQAAALALRELRRSQRVTRVTTAGPGGAVVAPGTVAARTTVQEV